MIVVKVETWPQGDANQADLRGVICIANRGPYGLEPRLEPNGQYWDDADPDHFKYEAELQSPDGAKRRVFIDHWRRHGWVTLVAKALEALDRRR